MRRVLCIGDAACTTGFARVVRGICDRLDISRRYEPVVRAINYTSGYPQDYAYEVRPVTSDHTADPLGIYEFEEHLERVQPDVLLIVQDLWHSLQYLVRKPKELPSVVYFPVDTPNMKWNYAIAAASTSEIVSYTRFGAYETAAGLQSALGLMRQSLPNGVGSNTKTDWFTMPKEGIEMHCRMDRLARFQNPGQWNIIPHGAEHDKFTPMDKATARKLWGVPENKFVVLNVNTNQFRKRQDLTIRAFAELARNRDDVMLMMHCMGGSMATAGWDLAQLVSQYGVGGKVALTHTKMPVLTDEQLAALYACADVQVNTAGGEGWGLTSQEGASVGIAQLVPDWSATREIWGSVPGSLIRVSDWRQEPKFLNTAHAIIDPRWLGQRLIHLHDHRDELAELARACKSVADKQFSWDQVGDAFATVLDRACDEGPARMMSLDDVQAECRGTVIGEIDGRVDMQDPLPEGFLNF